MAHKFNESPRFSFLDIFPLTHLCFLRFFSVSSSDLVSKWQGESEKLVRNLFEMAREAGKAIIFIDEVDSLAGSRSEGESDSSRRIKTEFLVQMDGVGKGNKNDVLVLGATNVPWELDAAIRRRFEKRIYIPLPEAAARTYMLKLHLGDTPHSVTERDFMRLGEKCEGASGSDISVVVRDALMQPLRKCQQAKEFIIDKDGMMRPVGNDPKLPGEKVVKMQLWDVPSEKLRVPDVCKEDFEKVMEHSVSSVSPEELDRFVDWTKQFGQEGI